MDGGITITDVKKNFNGSTENMAAPGNTIQAGNLNSNLKILLVEDFEINRIFFVKFLEKNGFCCDTAADGEEALRAFSEKNYDLIFMDCQMPVMDGFQAARKIREIEGGQKHTTIIAMTACTMEGDMEKCLEAGMDDYLSKPFKFEYVMEMLQKYLKTTYKNTNKAESENHFSEVISLLMEASDFDKNTCLELVISFLKHAKESICKIEEHMGNGNLKDAGILLHQLKGSAGNLRANVLAEKAAEAEEAIKTSDNEKLFDSLGRIKRIIDDFIEESKEGQ